MATKRLAQCVRTASVWKIPRRHDVIFDGWSKRSKGSRTENMRKGALEPGKYGLDGERSGRNDLEIEGFSYRHSGIEISHRFLLLSISEIFLPSPLRSSSRRWSSPRLAFFDADIRRILIRKSVSKYASRKNKEYRIVASVEAWSAFKHLHLSGWKPTHQVSVLAAALGKQLLEEMRSWDEALVFWPLDLVLTPMRRRRRSEDVINIARLVGRIRG